MSDKKKTAKKNKNNNTEKKVSAQPQTKVETPVKFPDKVPFWARLRIEKKRTTLVIDKERGIDKRTGKESDLFVHREATHTKNKDYEEISPNPDKSDPNPMYLKHPEKKPKRLFKPHNKQLDMPEDLKARYEKNNKKQ